tara:strand:- start:2627 stop:3277 length:651 start_codon:yes stop_codon:yes gene_type:complete
LNKNQKKYDKNIKKRISREKKKKSKLIRRYIAFSSIGLIGFLFILGLVLPGLPIQFWNNDIPDGNWKKVSNMGWGILPNIDVVHDPYNSTPATSGPFLDEKWGCPIRWGYHEDQSTDECLVSNLARGGVNIQYDCSLDDPSCVQLIDNLKNSFTGANLSEVVIIPYSGLNNRIALTAWNYIDEFDEFDKVRISTFIDTFLNNPTLAPFYEKKGFLN